MNTGLWNMASGFGPAVRPGMTKPGRAAALGCMATRRRLPLAGAAIATAGSPATRQEWLPKITAGEAKATLAATEPNARWDAAGITLAAREERGGFVLNGSKMFVPDAHLADVLVVAARTRDGSTMEDGVSLFLVPQGAAGLAVRLLPSVDETRKLCVVRLDNVTVPASALIGELHQGWAP